MKLTSHQLGRVAISALLGMAGAALAQAQPAGPEGLRPAVADDLPDVDGLQGPQVLEQGPLHEAFAKPLAWEDQAIVIDREPPAAVDELPPEQRPEGPNVNWLPGYWFFDSERDDFVWVSGLWRNFPPGRDWVPGQWQQVADGYQWVAGYWAEAQQPQALLPAPPATLEMGPSSPAPGDDYLWTPGCWQWGASGYAWQAGFWYATQPDWVWMPNHYCYTPGGAVYVSGYWDYPLTRRGLVYAPVFWGAHYRFSGAAIYRPQAIINTALLIANLFVDHRHGRYYYGSQWGRDRYRPSGLVAWNDRSYGRWGYHHGKSKLHDPLRAHFQPDGRPQGAHGQNAAVAGQPGAGRSRTAPLVQSVHRLSAADRQALKLRQNNPAELANFRQQNEKYRSFDRQGLSRDRQGQPVNNDSAEPQVTQLSAQGNRAAARARANMTGRSPGAKVTRQAAEPVHSSLGTGHAPAVRNNTADSTRNRAGTRLPDDRGGKASSLAQVKAQQRMKVQQNADAAGGAAIRRQPVDAMDRRQAVHRQHGQFNRDRQLDLQQSRRNIGAQTGSAAPAQPPQLRMAQPSSNSALRSTRQTLRSQVVARPTTSMRSGMTSGNSQVGQSRHLNQAQAVRRQQQAQPQFGRSGGGRALQGTRPGGGRGGGGGGGGGGRGKR